MFPPVKSKKTAVLLRKLRWPFLIAIVLVTMGILFSNNKITPEIEKQNISASLAKRMTEYGVKQVDKYVDLSAVKFKDENGNLLTLRDFQGGDMIVAIWASWCESCRKELPYFNRTASSYKKQGIEFLPISVDESGLSSASAYFEKNNIDKLPLYNDSTIAVLEALDVGVIPVMIFINADGNEVGRHIGNLSEALISE